MKFSRRIEKLTVSKSIALSALTTKLKSEGRDIIELHLGEPDFSPPKTILDAVGTALEEGAIRYGEVRGLGSLRKKIIDRFNLSKGTNLGFENVIIGNGSKHILYNIFQSLCQEDDEVIILKPYWISFPESVKLSGATPVFVEHAGLRIDFKDLEKKLSAKTKILLLNTPNNPSGIVYNEEEISRLAELSLKYDFLIVCDEAYEAFLFDTDDLPCPAQLGKDILARTITVQSFSKTYCLTGLRIGYAVASKNIIDAMADLQGHLSGNVCTPIQYAALEALDSHPQFLKDMVHTFKKRRDFAYNLFSGTFKMDKPAGAFFLLVHIGSFLDRFADSDALCAYILEEANVALLPGSVFGADDYIRIAYASDEEVLERAYARIRNIL